MSNDHRQEIVDGLSNENSFFARCRFIIVSHQICYRKTANINVKKTYQFEHNVKDDQIIRQKLQISNLLLLKIVEHVIWNGASVDAK
jgi:hypothetical protein